MATDLRGTEILGFRVVERIAEGGMGSVWRGEHPDLEEVRAIKVLNPILATDPDLVERFVQEAKVQIRLAHPNIVRVENFSREHLAMVMEHVEGDTLSDLIGRKVGAIPAERALPMMKQILAAVGYAHEHEVIHRDIKPSNIMVTKDNVVKVMDFGIAKVVRGARLTQTGTALGTAVYMSPEQIKGSKDVDARSDIYSLGVTFYEMLGGRPPFEAEKGSDSDYMIKEAHVHRAPPDPREFYEHIPGGLVRVVLRCLAKDPADRYQTAGELQRALVDCTGKAAATRIERRFDVRVPRGEPRTVQASTQRLHGDAGVEGVSKPGGLRALIVLGVGLLVLLAGVFLWIGHRGTTLKPAPPKVGTPGLVDGSTRVQPRGTLLLEGSPSQAVVSVEGPNGHRQAGKLGTALSGLSPGTYKVRVSQAEYQPHESSVKIVAGEIARKNVKLNKLVESGKGGLKWVLIPGGRFMMGSENGSGSEKPVHTVTVNIFRMSMTEVTVGQYRSCVQDGACVATSSEGYCTWGQTSRDDVPMNCMTWSKARTFCRWANGRLPSESEWEYAARSGGKNIKYPWGDQEPSCERVAMKSGNKMGCGYSAWPVCAKSAGKTTHGLCDMSGNMAEWVEDTWHPNYKGAPTDGSAWASNASRSGWRVMRGGALNDPISYLSTTYRKSSSGTYYFYGFRCAKSMEQAELDRQELQAMREAAARKVRLAVWEKCMEKCCGQDDTGFDTCCSGGCYHGAGSCGECAPVVTRKCARRCGSRPR